jgi:hypothetical protein
MHRIGWRVALAGTAAIGTAISLTGTGIAAPGGVHGAASRQLASNAYAMTHTAATGSRQTRDDGDLADQIAEYG